MSYPTSLLFSSKNSKGLYPASSPNTNFPLDFTSPSVSAVATLTGSKQATSVVMNFFNIGFSLSLSFSLKLQPQSLPTFLNLGEVVLDLRCPKMLFQLSALRPKGKRPCIALQ